MNVRVTRKEVMRTHNTVICVGYCELQHLLEMSSVVGHTERREGWGADVYEFGSTAIVTGYAPFGNVRADYDLCMMYDKKAMEMTGKNKRERLHNLIMDFIGDVKKASEK